MIKVYVAGPIMGCAPSEPFSNVGDMIRTADDLAELGLCPFVPGLAALWSMTCDRSRDFFTMWSMEWLSTCDCVYRMPGDSDGTDLETEAAEQLGLPVFMSLDGIQRWVAERDSAP